ncbi:MAG TPA: hypothetical protein VGZ32_24830 [Actinocrinis sp.]|uniref:hypothetical protein n=1 Tax=Actinocrinis sp. TaxID=1920516 RepID=UPI002DDCB1D3|nr:hypothetical protein [Actinocrinis sp.]HEV3173598.1 hypothetical protein [Actinocrinis sp.]
MAVAPVAADAGALGDAESVMIVVPPPAALGVGALALLVATTGFPLPESVAAGCDVALKSATMKTTATAAPASSVTCCVFGLFNLIPPRMEYAPEEAGVQTSFGNSGLGHTILPERSKRLVGPRV